MRKVARDGGRPNNTQDVETLKQEKATSRTIFLLKSRAAPKLAVVLLKAAQAFEGKVLIDISSVSDVYSHSAVRSGSRSRDEAQVL